MMTLLFSKQCILPSFRAKGKFEMPFEQRSRKPFRAGPARCGWLWVAVGLRERAETNESHVQP